MNELRKRVRAIDRKLGCLQNAVHDRSLILPSLFMPVILEEIDNLPERVRERMVQTLAKIYMYKFEKCPKKGNIFGLANIVFHPNIGDMFCRVTFIKAGPKCICTSILSRLLMFDKYDFGPTYQGKYFVNALPIDTLYRYAVMHPDGMPFMEGACTPDGSISEITASVYSGIRNGYAKKMMELVRKYPDVLRICNMDGTSVYALLCKHFLTLPDKFFILEHSAPSQEDLVYLKCHLCEMIPLVKTWRDLDWDMNSILKPAIHHSCRGLPREILFGDHPFYFRTHDLIRQYSSKNYVQATHLLKHLTES